MKLYEGNLFWQQIPFEINELEDSAQCDVLVIGAGLSGLFAANKLQKEGYKTIIVEQNGVGLGSTLSRFGFVQCYDKEDLDAFNEFESIINNAMKTVEYNRVKTLVFNKDSKDMDDDVPFTEISNEDLRNNYEIIKDHAFMTYKNATFNPHKLAIFLANQFVNLGGKIYKGTFREHIYNYAYFTNESRIKFKDLVFAAGMETNDFKKIHAVYPKVQYTIVSEPIQEEQIAISIFDRSELHIRMTSDKRLMITGNETYSLKYGFQEMFVKTKQLYYELVKLMPKYRNLPIEFEYASVVPMARLDQHHLERENNIFYIYAYGNNNVLHAIHACNQLSKDIKKHQFE